MKPIINAPPSKESQIYADQADLFILLIRQLVEADRETPRKSFREMPEYDRFLLGSYACGFVPTGFTINFELFQKFMNDPRQILKSTFPQLRSFTHYLLRSERHSDAGGEYSDVMNAARNGALSAVADRLETAKWRE